VIGILRGLITLALLLLFVALVVWAWSDRRKKTFDAMARMALDDDAPASSNASTTGGKASTTEDKR
jgi:cytochrome c oxidase cbb3-type subunit 4